MGRAPAPVALLVVDMLNLFDFPDGAAMAAAARRITPAIARLRARFDRAGAPVIHVNDNFAQWRGEFADLVAACGAAGGTPSYIAARLAPLPQHYHVLKPRHSGFACSALPVLLETLAVRRLVVAGIAADSCVLATAQDANARDFSLWIPGDCVASRRAAWTRQALALMRHSLGARIAASGNVRGLFPRSGSN